MPKDNVFKALSDPNRRKILQLLKKVDALTVGKIAKEFDISQPSVSDHLKILRNADLVYSEKKGQYVHYYLNTTVFEDIVSYFMNIVTTSKEQ
ncbi:MAG: autorepressor SdpR family transcription factor [Candidatus Zophobacter franzmannii]|jgi:DNA-binding transcriptional ArsR family regulator|nr:autorepressor SdpR family transcription factor [Candidatus Zophobacter franzmannii]